MPEPMLTRTVEAIRNAQLLLPAEEVNTHILEACNRLLTADQDLSVERAQQRIWEALKERMNDSVRDRAARHRRVRLVVVITLLIVLLATLCLAAIPWIRRLFWNDDVLQVEIAPGSAQQSAAWNEPNDVLGLAFLQSLSEQNITAPLPGWLPEGYALTNVESRQADSMRAQVIGYYGRDDTEDHLLIIEVNQWQPEAWDADVTTIAEKDTQPIATYQLGRITVTVYENLGFFSARFLAEPCVVDIVGNGVTYDELWSIIASTQEGSIRE